MNLREGDTLWKLVIIESPIQIDDDTRLALEARIAASCKTIGIEAAVLVVENGARLRVEDL